LQNGLESRKVILRGLPVRPAFWKASRPKVIVRKQLGLDQNLKTVLLMGGGDGVGGLAPIATAVASRLKELKQSAQLVVICGHNKKMSDCLKSSLKQTDTMKVSIRGFVNNIDEFMAASDCLITKAGPGTIAESMIRGLPLILSYYLPGQVSLFISHLFFYLILFFAKEYGNIPYVVDGGFGVYTGNRPKRIANTVGKFFMDEKMLKEMSVKGQKASDREATRTIAKEIGETVLANKI
jgi:1,2-diacylglycerol 3-beta-galactosyltransferase